MEAIVQGTSDCGFYIDSHGGRIGPLWWVNADPRILDYTMTYKNMQWTRKMVLFGSFGWGDEIRYAFEQVS